MALTKPAYHILMYVELIWNRDSRFPDVEEIFEYINSHRNATKPPLDAGQTVSIEEIQETIIKDKDLHRSFEVRGIEWQSQEGYSGLNEEQLAVAAVVLDYTDTRPVAQKLKQLGIPASQYRGWLRSKVFREYVQRRSEHLFGDGLHEAHTALMKRVNDGDIKAIKLYYEMAGRWTSKPQESDFDLRVLMTRIIEIIQSTIQDADTQRAVAAKLGKLILSNQPKELTTYVYPDSEIATREARIT